MDGDTYLVHLSRYLHLNPVLAGLVEAPEDWRYSSYKDFAGLRSGTLPNPQIVLDQFPSVEAYREFVLAYLPEDYAVVADLVGA